MSNIDKLALREAAEKATPGVWVEKRGEVTTEDYEVEGATYLDLICECEIVGTESPNAEFIAAANPATVLALLDELEAAEKRIAELEAREVKLPDIKNYLSDVTEPTLDRALRLTAKGVRSGDVAAIRAAGIRIKGE